MAQPKKVNYLNNKDILKEIHKSKMTYCYVADDKYASFDVILEDVKKNIGQVIQSGQFVLGPIVEELEQKIAAYCETKYAVGVSSGTDALLISLMAAGMMVLKFESIKSPQVGIF